MLCIIAPLLVKDLEAIAQEACGKVSRGRKRVGDVPPANDVMRKEKLACELVIPCTAPKRQCHERRPGDCACDKVVVA